MITTVVKVKLPVDETLEIRKMRLEPEQNKGKKRISIVTGIHGDELEGQYVCYRLSRYLQENRQYLRGIVDIYPALNPFGIDSITRGIPAFDLDMNRIFPGSSEGDMNEYLAAEILRDVSGSALVLDIHASNIFLTEVPQIRINELHEAALLPYAMEANVDFVWVHGASTVLESTFAYSLNAMGTPTLVVEMGVGMRITQAYGEQLVQGILHLMSKMGIWEGEDFAVRRPVVSAEAGDVCFLNAATSGIFLKYGNHGERVCKGDLIGVIVNPLSGEETERIESPADGWLFTVREYPVVSEGSLVGRVLCKQTGRFTGQESDLP